MTATLSGVHADDGLPALDPAPTRLAETLDRLCTDWAQATGATPLTVPPLLRVEDLARLGVYENFPQLALVSSSLNVEDTSSGCLAQQAAAGRFTPKALHSAQLALPSSACYGVYLHYQGRQLDEAGALVTVLGQCYRNEDHYDGLRRLKAFRMREVICLGTAEQAAAHLEHSSQFIERLTAAIGLPVRRHAASDPFYDQNGDRAAFQRVVTVKHEYHYGGMAIASVNTHHKFFGERCDITVPGEDVSASTSCVGFGIERWLHALADHFGDWSHAQAAVEKAARSISS
ncbi:aminoacyl--tRNA ligase-related protein [Streptomyces roseochromogenus]|uniref:Aminoacyl-tRNA synthetase class II (G/ P/ S/T) domain-containing protein n=1 Tax=Streptomyces roseochromogenus subsp. oscitans DS 12.976 TaxID=1352936 RepID=V6KTX5_STRRC|nr:aminoacyl--tRNA ligase-related protein [Streptomyces roseochromogenus]EST35473.1 hypothetical protein M878_05830 [Streptomyces roseochromogenus subsp. oscitans DS 12.976]